MPYKNMCMKNKMWLLPFLFFTSMYQLSYAEKVNETIAKDIASQFLSQKLSGLAKTRGSNASASVDLSLVKTETFKKDTVFYAFNNRQDEGFVIVSADDNAPEILGYSDVGRFDMNNMSPATRTMLSKYAEYVSMAKNGRAEKVGTFGEGIFANALISTKWGQGSPYNIKCPGVTGCMATALAQIMYYYKWPQTGVGEKTYLNEFTNKVISLSYGSDVYRYDYMLSICDGAPSLTTDAVSTLMYHVGVASETQYGNEKSGARIDLALEGMKEHFNYDKNARLEYAINYTKEQWNAMLFNELAQGRPVVYAAQSYDIGSVNYSLEMNFGAHAFIIDGINAQHVHINWGWDGAADGYYTLTTMLGFNENQCAFIGLKPADDTPASTDNRFRWGYCDDAVIPFGGGDGIIGGAIMIPSEELNPYIGKTITGMEVGLAGEVGNFNYFVSANINAVKTTRAAVDSGILAHGNLGDGNIGWNRIEFDTPVLIDGNNLYVGYTCKKKEGQYPVAVSGRKNWNDTYNGNTCCRLVDGNWRQDYSKTLCIRAVFDDQDLPNDMRLTALEDVSCYSTDEVFYLTGDVENMMSAKVTNYTIAYQIDGNAIQYYNVNNNINRNEIVRFSVPITNTFSAGIHKLSAWIDKVNDMPDVVSQNSDYYKNHPVTLKVHGKTFARRNVMESYISTSCGYSPRAILADKVFRQKYTDSYIGINIHEDIMYGPDPMSNVENYGSSYSTPTTFINRIDTRNDSPMPLEIAFSTDADFDLQAESSFSSSGTISITSHVVPGMDISGQYRMAYVITEDNVGPYNQQVWIGDNPYYHWEDGSSSLFDGVARGIYPEVNGIANSLPKSMIADHSYEHSYQLNLPNNIENLDKINIIVLIINQSTGEIENAYSMKPLSPDGITTLRFKNPLYNININDGIQLELTSVGLSAEALLEWSSSNPAVAEVSSTGVVRALKNGSTIISVQVKDHSETKTTCQINVTEKKWTFDKSTGTLSIQGEGKMPYSEALGDWDGIKDDIEHVVVGEGITSLPTRAFNECKSIESVSLPSSLVSIGLGAFKNCVNLKEINIPEGVEYIEPETFWGCESLEKVILPLKLKRIGAWAFSASGIKEMEIPEGVEYIDYCAFRYCSRLEKATLPSSLRHIGVYLLDGTWDLSELHVNWKSFEGVYIENDALTGVDRNKVLLIVPKGYAELYRSTFPWSDFTIKEDEASSIIERIEDVTSDMQQPFYDILGRRVSKLNSGNLYVKGGKKVLCY